MTTVNRREVLAAAVKLAGGALALSVPQALYRSPWLELAQAQTLPTVQRTFVALVGAVNDADEADARTAAVAAWIIREFDLALPPLPDRSVTAAVAAVLDAYTVKGAYGPTFADAPREGRLNALGDMVKDEQPDIRQIANQILPFASFAYWSDASLGRPAKPGDTMPQWTEIGWSGPSHGHLDDFMRDWPQDPAFKPRGHAGDTEG